MKMDIVDLSTPTVDRLDEIFQLQGNLQRKLGYDVSGMTIDEKIEYIRWNMLALSSELAEAANEVGWKPWSSSRYIDRDKYVSELRDALQFLVNLFLVVDADSRELIQRYRGKIKVNHERHENGYDGINGKCEHCHRALDEPTATVS